MRTRLHADMVLPVFCWSRASLSHQPHAQRLLGKRETQSNSSLRDLMATGCLGLMSVKPWLCQSWMFPYTTCATCSHAHPHPRMIGACTDAKTRAITLQSTHYA